MSAFGRAPPRSYRCSTTLRSDEWSHPWSRSREGVTLRCNELRLLYRGTGQSPGVREGRPGRDPLGIGFSNE